MKAPDTFGSLLAVGITTFIGVQVIINIAVVTGLIPVSYTHLDVYKRPYCVCGAKSLGKIIHKKPIEATREETERNTRSKSAKLRIFEKR